MNRYKVISSYVKYIKADTFRAEGKYIVFYIEGRVEMSGNVVLEKPVYLCSDAVTVEIANE